jgi:hypothetical protein
MATAARKEGVLQAVLDRQRELLPGEPEKTAEEGREDLLEELTEKMTTGFYVHNGRPVLIAYQCRGFLKEAGSTFNGLAGAAEGTTVGVKNLKSKLTQLVFVQPTPEDSAALGRHSDVIPLHLPEGAEKDILERPLRGQTAQGPRTSLARSERLPQGTWFECVLKVYPNGHKEMSERLLVDLLDYGENQGMLQWRTGGHGRFQYRMTKLPGDPYPHPTQADDW